jgi:hypothetical protein
LPVIVTRTLPGARDTADSLLRLGYAPILSPMLAIEETGLDARDLAGIRHLVFTSANGVRALHGAPLDPDLIAWCVGPSTAEAAREAGFGAITESDGNADDLARRILAARPGGPLLRAALTVQHVGARHVVRAVAHQRQLNLVLHFLDMDGAAGRLPPYQRADHGCRQPLDLLAHGGRRRALTATHGEKRLGHRHCDLAGLERHDRAIAADQLVVGQRGGHRAACGHEYGRPFWRGNRCKPCDRADQAHFLMLHPTSDILFVVMTAGPRTDVTPASTHNPLLHRVWALNPLTAGIAQ